MAPHSSTLAWKIPWTEEPGKLQSPGSQGVVHVWATSLSLFSFMHWRRKWQSTPMFCLENPRDGGAWWANIYGVAQSQTWLKWLSSSSSIYHDLRIILYEMYVIRASQVAQVVKNPLANAGDAQDVGSILGLEDSLEKEMANYYTILVWKISWTGVSAWILSMRS